MACGTFALPRWRPPLLHDDWGKWMGATLTADGTALCLQSAAAAWGFWTFPRPYETVVRPGSGGPRRIGGLLVYRSASLEGDLSTKRGIPITTPARTVFDLSSRVSQKALAWVVRTAVRMGRTNLVELGDTIGEHHGRRGSTALGKVISNPSGLPLERARSGAEIRSLELLRDSGRPMARLNHKVAGEEADLSWPELKLIVEIDGAPWHLDTGEDSRKEAVWRSAGWTVRRIPSDNVYDHPAMFLALAPVALC